MDSAQYERIQQLFEACRALPQAERAILLSDGAKGDAEVEREVSSLLDAYDRSLKFLEEPALEQQAEILEQAIRPRRAGLAPGARVGPYEIVGPLGAGGMGEVYRARDSRLRRDVALKILPAEVANDPARRARFQIEARAVAALNHPNIAAIYGVEDDALVMELVPGPTLEERIRDGVIPLDEAIRIAKQIVEGLEAAHERGIVHRDLKPANIKVTLDGVVKLLDFGLAKEIEPGLRDGSPSLSPTLSVQMTQFGTILGTAGYMAPEQARGKPVDKRADIWAFGAVLFETLTGKQAFAGPTLADIIAAVVTREPDWSALPKDTPLHILRLLERCLCKDPKLRLRDIGEARIALDKPPAEAPPATVAPRRSWLIWLAAGLALAAGVAGLTVAWLRPKPADPVTVRFRLPLPDGTTDAGSPAVPLAVPSPNGRFLALIANGPDKKGAVWIRPIGSPSVRRLDGTEGASHAFWSPDGQFIAFFADEKLKKIPVAGGSPQNLCNAPRADYALNGDGGTWNVGGIILFGLGAGSALTRVLAQGGPAIPATTLDASAGETRHGWPQFLPDGRHFLYFAANRDPAKSAIYVQELGSSQRVLVMRSRQRAAWAPPGYLLFPSEGTLFAQRMDLKTFQPAGESVSVAEEVTSNEANGRSSFAVSGNGVLVYRRGSLIGNSRPVWYDRAGRRLAEAGKPGEYNAVSLSPDERSVAFVVGFQGRYETWIMDLASGSLRRAANVASSPYLGPWSADSERLAINQAYTKGILEWTVASDKTRVLGKAGLYALDWSPDDHWILCNDASFRQLSAIPIDGDQHPAPIGDTSYMRTQFRFSPDGRFVVYNSAEAGSNQIFVAALPSFSEKRQISIDGGEWPTWNRNGREVFYRTADGTLMSAEIRTEGKLGAGAPKPLFKYSTTPNTASYWPARDGQRFLVIEHEQRVEGPQYMVVVNWNAELKR